MYDIANELEREFRQSAVYNNLKEAMAKINADESVKKEFEAFKELTVKFQQMQMSGQQPSEDELKAVQEAATKAQAIEAIQNLMIAEQQASILIDDLNRMITKPLVELYNN